MTTFQITSKTNGMILGVFEAKDEADALDAFAWDVGADDFRDLCAIADSDEFDGYDELVVDDLIVEAI